MSKIVETDNFNGDHPDEKFLSLTDSKGKSVPLTFPATLGGELRIRRILAELNGEDPEPRRWFRVVPNDYQLQPGFEP